LSASNPADQGVRVAIASDHAGVAVKAELCEFLSSLGYTPVDLGPETTESVDYPDFAHRLANSVVAGNEQWGILICGTGIGMSIAANKVPGARAALCMEPFSASMARNHNDANVLVLGARVTGPELMRAIIRSFASSPFTPGDDGRHLRRVQHIEPA
jgi:ribose 5-phosphate isomerase B